MITHVVTETGFVEVSYEDGGPVKVTSGFLSGITKSKKSGIPDMKHYTTHIHEFGPEHKEDLGKFVNALIQSMHYLVGESG